MPINPYIIGGVIILVLILLGSSGLLFMNNNPKFLDIEIQPTQYITYYEYQNDEVNKIFYKIDNPTNLDFSGSVEFLYDDDCFNIYQNLQQVSVPAKSQQGFFKEIRLEGRNIPNKCFSTQTILLRMVNENKTIIYDTEEIKITIVKS